MDYPSNIKISIIALTLILLVSCMAPAALAFPYESSDQPIQDALNYLKAQQNADGSIGSASYNCWVIQAIAAAGENPNNWKYQGNGPSPVDYLRNQVQSNWSSIKDDPFNPPNAIARTILAVVAAGGDPRSFGGQNLVEELFEYVDSQTGEVNNPKDPNTINEEPWCIMALISAGVSKSSQTIKNMVEFLKQQQNNDGGWGYAKGVSSDVDCTAAVTLALLVAGESTSSQEIQDALNFIKNNQGSGGGFISWGSENIYSTTWVVWALNAANEDPTSNNWKKNGNSPIDFILSKQQADGSYSSDIYVTACAIIALLGSYPPVKILTSVVKEVDISKMLTFQSQARSILETEGDVNKAYELLAEAGYLPETPPKLPKSLYDRLAEIYGPNLERYPTIEGRILLLKSFGIEFLQS